MDFGPNIMALPYSNLHGKGILSYVQRWLMWKLPLSSKTLQFHSEPCNKQVLRKYQKIILQLVRLTSKKSPRGVQCRNRTVVNAAFFPPEGVCLHVIDFYLSLDGLIHRFNYIMYCPINTALQLFYIQPGCQIELNGFLKAYKAGKYLSLVGIFLHIGY